ncbi:unnamed protein product [Psylliodes chrysocephalus]|uniref:Uncharacterized protein n=1 Tax=Psylliodes chrysocephalus TaxID=3402493 RepID=A0A9P0D2B3_9CUCU|nr:unnamed protein product [Psylliodes chrysocephala]
MQAFLLKKTFLLKKPFYHLILQSSVSYRLSSQPSTSRGSSASFNRKFPLIASACGRTVVSDSSAVSFINALLKGKDNHLKCSGSNDSITNDLNSSGFTKPVNAIQNKWKSPMRSYTKCKDNRNRTGQGPSRFLCYERIDDFVGDKPQNECSHSINSLEDSESDVTVENIEDEENIQPESINKNTEPGITENADGNMQEKYTNSQDHHKKRLSEKQIKKEYFEIKKEEYKKRQIRHEEKMQVEKRKLDLLEIFIQEKKTSHPKTHDILMCHFV